MKVKGVAQHPNRCLCGKATYFTEDAARFAGRTGEVSLALKAWRPYECWWRPGVWHLTSMTVGQHNRRTRQWALATLDQWGTTKTMTVRVRPGCRRSIPNPLKVVVIWRSVSKSR